MKNQTNSTPEGGTEPIPSNGIFPPTEAQIQHDERLLVTLAAGYTMGRGSNIEPLAAARWAHNTLKTIRAFEAGEVKGQNA